MTDWIKVASLQDCPPGSLRPVMVGNDPVVLANVDGTLYAVRDRCSHEEYPLSDGEIEGEQRGVPVSRGPVRPCFRRPPGSPGGQAR
jgi:3-phenylpropionate/trans-cinnamate dioxygenase ferredoxin component